MGVEADPDTDLQSADAVSTQRDNHWMQRALELAQQAAAGGEVPVGAVLVGADGQELGAGHNAVITNHDPTAHAEIIALRAAAIRSQNYRLTGTTLYVTLEPCAMCAGAIVHARIGRVVFGTSDPRAGAAGSVMNVLQHDALNHQTQVASGFERDACAALLVDFFAARRGKR